MKRRFERAVPAFLLLVVLGAAAFVAGVWSKVAKHQREPLPRFARVGDFRFIERSGRAVTQVDVSGKFLVVDFFFASCSTECQVLGRRMKEVQELTSGMGDVMLLSLTVDPRSDSPKVLARRAEELSASPTRWLFLTGEKTNLYPFIQKHFLLPVGEDAASTFGGLLHSSKIALVDRRGIVRGYYDGLATGSPSWILRDIQRLRREDPPWLARPDE